MRFTITQSFYLQRSQRLTTLGSNFVAQCLRSCADKKLDRRFHGGGHLMMGYLTDPIAIRLSV